MNSENTTRLLASLSLYPMTRCLHMPQPQYRDMLSEAQREASDPRLKAYFPL